MLRQRAISSIFIVGLTLGPAMFGRSIFTALIAAILALALRETYGMFRHAGHRPLDWAGYGALALFLAAAFSRGWERWGAGLITAVVILPLFALLFRAEGRNALADWALTVTGALYIGLPAVHFFLLRDLAGPLPSFLERVDEVGRWQYREFNQTTRGLGWYLTAQIVTWLSDTGAYAAGRRWGRRKLAPAVSPGKSVEGALGGLVAGALVAWLCAYAFGLPLGPLQALGVGATLSIVGQLGDLAESLLKRQVGVKDSGTLIPGHGGVLDRIDGLLVVVVVAYYLARLLSWFGAGA